MSATSLKLSPLLAPELLWPLLALAAAAVLLGLLRRARGGPLRLLAGAALGLGLLNPSLVHEQRDPVKDVGVVVVDRSPSQRVGQRLPRTEAALEALRAQAAAFPDLELRTVEVPGGDDTRLFEALDKAIADVPRDRLAGAILLTDGQVHDVPADAERLKGYGPVHALLSGEHDERDRRILVKSAPAFGIVGRTVTLTYQVDDTPGIGAQQAEVTLRTAGGQSRRLSARIGVEQSIELPVAHGGENVFELEAAPVPGELTLANNRAAITVNGVRDRLRVLLVSGEPHMGERTWRNLLKSDPSVDLVHFTILRPPDKQDGTPTRELSLISFPVRELFEVKLNEFDLVIFDSYEQRGILPPQYFENIAAYVANGGALLDASGPGAREGLSLYETALQRVLPGQRPGGLQDTIAQAFRPTVTARGRRHPVTAALPGEGAAGEAPSWGRWFRQQAMLPGHASVLMDGAPGRPLLMLDRVGEGRVAALTSDQIWLWSRGFEGGGPQAELLRRLAHWLMQEPELEEDLLSAHADGTRLTVSRRSLDPRTDAVTLTSPSGAKRVLTLAEGGRTEGLATAEVEADEPGVWTATDHALDRQGRPTGPERTALAVVGAADSPELRDVRTTPDKLAPAAEVSGGGVLWLVDGTPELRRVDKGRIAAGRGWVGLTRNGQAVVTGVTEVPLLPGLAALAAILLLGGTWRREGR